jgi:hypothetical protein
MFSEGLVMTDAVHTSHQPILDGMDDVPPAPPSYNQYVERTLHERMQAAYERGLLHGYRYRLGVLVVGLIIGWIAGFSSANMQ